MEHHSLTEASICRLSLGDSHIPNVFNQDEPMVSWLLCTAGSIPCSEVPFFLFLFFSIFLNRAVLSYSTNDLHGNQSYPKNATKLCKPTPSFQLQTIFCPLWLGPL